MHMNNTNTRIGRYTAYCFNPMILLCRTTGDRCTTYYTGWKQVAKCSPKCANGGQCVGPNRCRCADGYKGAWCQNGKIVVYTHRVVVYY